MLLQNRQLHGALQHDHRLIVDAGDVDAQRPGRRIGIDAGSREAAADHLGRAAVVLHLEGEGPQAFCAPLTTPLKSAAGTNLKLPAVMLATGIDWPALTVPPLRVRMPTLAAGTLVTLTADRLSPVVAWIGAGFAGTRVVGVAEAEVAGDERVTGAVFQQRDAAIDPVGAAGRIVDGRDGKGQRVGRRIGVLTAASRAGVVLDLEEDLAFSRTGQIGARRELELAGLDAGHRDHLAAGNRSAVESQRAAGGQLADRNDHVGERKRRGVELIHEAKVAIGTGGVARSEDRVGLVFGDGAGRIGPLRRHGNLVDVQPHRVGQEGRVDAGGGELARDDRARDREAGAFLGRDGGDAAIVQNDELEAGIAGAELVGSRRELQEPIGEVG